VKYIIIPKNGRGKIMVSHSIFVSGVSFPFTTTKNKKKEIRKEKTQN
jgi:hypothetical protein